MEIIVLFYRRMIKMMAIKKMTLKVLHPLILSIKNMKKRYLALVIIGFVLLFSFIPHYVVLKDGGTKTYTSLLYKVIVWNHFYTSERQIKQYHGTELYIFPNNFYSMEYYSKNIEKKIQSS